MIYIGKTYRIYFLLIHPTTGAPITSPTDPVSVIVIDESGNKTTHTATEKSDGWYYHDLTPDAEGTWAVRFNYEGVTPYQKGGWADYAIADQDAKLDTIDTVVDSNYALLAHGTYGLSALKTLLDAKASSSALATVDTNVDTILSRVTGAVALEATLTAIKGAGWTTETLKAVYDLIAALNNITAADVWTAANRELSTPANYKADVSNLDVAVSTRAPSGEYDTEAAHLDADISAIIQQVALTGHPANSIGKILYDFYNTRLTSTRTGYLDNLSAGAVALEATLTAMKGAGWTDETLKAIKDGGDSGYTNITGTGFIADTHSLKNLYDLLVAIPTTTEAEGYVENAEDGGDLTHDITTANDQTETDVFEVTKTGIYALSVFFDLDVLETAAEGGTVTIRLYNKIDGTNYSDIPSATILYTVGSETEYPSIEAAMLHGYSKVTIQCNADVTATRQIALRKITRDLGA